MDGVREGGRHLRMDGWMDGGREGGIKGCIDGRDGWMDGRTDGWMDGWMDGPDRRRRNKRHILDQLRRGDTQLSGHRIALCRCPRRADDC